MAGLIKDSLWVFVNIKKILHNHIAVATNIQAQHSAALLQPADARRRCRRAGSPSLCSGHRGPWLSATRPRLRRAWKAEGGRPEVATK